MCEGSSCKISMSHLVRYLLSPRNEILGCLFSILLSTLPVMHLFNEAIEIILRGSGSFVGLCKEKRDSITHLHWCSQHFPGFLTDAPS